MLSNNSKLKPMAACGVCFLIGWFCAANRPLTLFADQAPVKVQAPAFPMNARIGSNIYLQTAAEFRACCNTIYTSAELRLDTILNRLNPKPARPAVVFDLDETVFDNSAFETFLYRSGLEYTDELWADYEENYSQDVTLIPGAKRFIDRAIKLGVTPIFISNRSETFKRSTIKALDRLGINPPKLTELVFLKPANQQSSDKSARRETVASRFNVLMYFGDNLRDFSESFAARKLPSDPKTADYLAAIRDRASVADEASCHWGVDWFVLPNPVYGEWEKLIGPDPIAIMHPTSMPPKNPR